VSSAEFETRLRARAALVGVLIPDLLLPRLQRYYEILARWNAAMNLAGLPLHTDAALDRLLVEPLAAAPYLHRPRSMIDIGSGGGSPGIPLALALGVEELRMVESRGRKAVFLREAARAVGLDRTEVLGARFESLTSDSRLRDAHDLLTVRAVRVGPHEVREFGGFVRPGGQMALFRSRGEGSLGSAGFRLDAEGRSELVVIEREAR
jgi:16S rRNA (guanine527-N7)-methyltransferase